MVKRGETYKGIFLTVFNKIKNQAKEREIKFTITMKYIGDLFEQQGGKCIYSGQDLTLKKHTKDNSQTASLDRKDSSKGYIKGNVQWIHKDINRLKNTFQEKEFIELCYQIVDHNNLQKILAKFVTEFEKKNKWS
jgi:hypothetical protein